MPDVAAALAVHVLAVLWWIAGLAFVTAVFLPSLRAGQHGDALAAFHAVENRFEPLARIAMVLAGLSGICMLFRLDAWSWFEQPRFWWLDLMVLYWLQFMLLLFVLGPAGMLERSMRHDSDQKRIWRRMQHLHSALLTVALIIVSGAVSGSH